MFNVRGISSILQVTILASLSIVSLMLVFGYVKDLSGDFENQLSPTVNCLTQKTKATSACIYDGQVLVNLEVGLDETVRKTDISLNGQTYSCGQNSCQSCSIEGIGKKTIYLNPVSASLQDNLVVSVNSCAPESISLTPC